MLCENCKSEITKESRSDKQSRLSFKWYMERGKATGNGESYERAFCKLHYGVPILREESQDFRESYDQVFKPIPYEQKLQIMELMQFPVTSLMTVKQMGRYLDTVDINSALAQIVLSKPDDLYYESIGIKRG